MVNPTSPLQLLAAGSLRDVLNEIAQIFEETSGALVKASYGPSGHLHDEIEQGCAFDVFASAAWAHTQDLAEKQQLSAAFRFAQNELCVVSRPVVGLTTSNLLEVLARPGVRLATSTPVSDPMGDYTWQFFKNADRVSAGLFALFDQKALKLSGARAPTPGETLPYISAFEEDLADAYIMYRTNAFITQQSVPDLLITPIPDALNVRSQYGIGARPGSGHGQHFVELVMGERGQSVLKKYGFS